MLGGTERASTVDGTRALLSTARLATLFNLPLAISAGWLLWRSLDWPLVGDATIFHFIAGQFQMGAIQYRDIFDINMPLIYFVHAAVIAIGGMGDGAWRAFDLTAAVLMSGLILVLVWPAGRAVAILAVLIVLVTHFLLGPYSAGQRDFLMSIPALAAALASAKAAEDQQHDRFYLVLVGVFAMTAASIKPSGMLLLLLPVFTRVKRDWRELQWVIIGAAGTGILVFGTLAAWGGLEPFITTMQDLMPRYASLGTRTVPEISEDVVVWLAPTAGLALAAVLNISAPKPPRVRAMIGLTLFGLIHLLVQRKGWFYHVYPLGIGLACWGAWSLASLSPWRAVVCLMVTAITPVWLAQEEALIRQGCIGCCSPLRPCRLRSKTDCRVARAFKCSIRTMEPSSPWRAPGCDRPRRISNGSLLSLPRISSGATSLPRSRAIRRPPSS